MISFPLWCQLFKKPYVNLFSHVIRQKVVPSCRISKKKKRKSGCSINQTPFFRTSSFYFTRQCIWHGVISSWLIAPCSKRKSCVIHSKSSSFCCSYISRCSSRFWQLLLVLYCTPYAVSALFHAVTLLTSFLLFGYCQQYSFPYPSSHLYFTLNFIS